jgi:DNA polymerase-3 subunit delta'
MFRQSIIGQYTNGQLLNINAKQREFLQKFHPSITNENILVLNEIINDAHYHLQRQANPKILFLDVSLKIFFQFKKR